MSYRECQFFSFRPFLHIALGVLLIFLCACGQSRDRHLARGEEYLHKRKFQEAVMEFQAAADIDKSSAEAHWGLARAYENLGQFTETVENLRKTVELAPDNLDAKVKLGNYYLLVTPPMTNESEKLLQEIFAKDENFIEGHVLKASILTVQNKPENEVLEVLNHAISLNPQRTETYISLARYFMKSEKAKEAEEALRKGISANPQIAVGYLEYGRFLDFANRPAEAEANFKQAIAIEPKNIEAHETFADFYTAQKQFEKAEQIYLELVQMQENSAESRVSLADFYARINRSDEAVRILTEIVSETPKYVRARYRLGEIYLDRRENAKASEQIESLLKINDKDAQALLLRARLLLGENKAEEAIKDLEEILKKQPSHRDALFLMTQARLNLGQTDQARAFIGDLDRFHPNYLKTRLLKIQAAFTDGDAAGAFRQANELYEIANATVADATTMTQEIAELRIRALSARGLANLELGKLAEAKADLQEVQKNSPKSSAALVNLAKVFVAERDWAESLNLYEKALTLDNKNFDALSGIINVLNRQKRFSESHARIDQVILAHAGQNDVLPFLHYLKADTFLAEKNPQVAENELKKALELDENYLPAYSAYASILVARNQTAEAIEQYKKAVEKKPSATLFTLIGMLEEATENFAEAEKNYRRALELSPGLPIAANNLAWLIADRSQGNLDEALMLAQGAVNKNANVSTYYDTLGWVYYKKGLYSPAAEQLRKAIALDEAEAKRTGNQPNASYRLRLGIILASSGDKLAARKEVETSLKSEKNMSPKEVQEAKNLLATL